MQTTIMTDIPVPLPPMMPPKKIITEIPAKPVVKREEYRKALLNAAAYCRVSTDSEDQLNSYFSQIEYYTSIISENQNWKLAGIFADEGLSGVSTKKRQQFNAMMRKCRAGKIDLIICKSVSRFARNTLDSIGYVRKLKKMGVGVIFEKEGVNTFEMDDELILTIFASLAQAESESLSKNVAMGFRQAFKAGKVNFHYKGFLGYEKGEDGQPKILDEEAAVVRRIYHRYLAGDSVAQIIRDLEADGIPSAKGCEKWSPGVVRYMLRNEKYMGDALLQKTYVADVLTKQVRQNLGELQQWYISNNHPAIIERDVWNKVQEEIARRGCKRKEPSKNARTMQSKYSGKFALNEILVCGECGTPYRRVTWARNGTKRVVWRCISRLEHGKERCKNSPTLHEVPLQAAVMDAISDLADRGTLTAALRAGTDAAYRVDKDSLIYRAAKSRLESLDAQFEKLLAYAGTAGPNAAHYDKKFKEIGEERAVKLEIVAEYEAHQSEHSHEAEIDAACEMLETESFTLDEYDDYLVRQIVDTIRVMEGGKLHITFKGGEVTEREVGLK
jgi:DNA invertase Pin-like site-specific DNA recombinase